MRFYPPPTGESELNLRLPSIEDGVCEMAHILFNFRQLRRPPGQRWRLGTTVGVGALGAFSG